MTSRMPADAIAVVTGASSGLGHALARALSRQGATVHAVARREPELAALTDELRAAAPDSDFHVCDVADPAAYQQVLAGVEGRHGRIDLLVHAAGIESRVAAADADLALYERTMAVNVMSAIAGTLQVLPGMLARGRGDLVHLSSDQGRAATPMTSAYSASKAALSAFTESVAHEVRGSGVFAHVVYPGWVPTPMGQNAVEHGMPMPPKAVRRTAEQVVEAVLRCLGRDQLEVNVARLGAMAPVAKALVPRIYTRSLTGR